MPRHGEVAAIGAAFEQRGELAAAIELRRLLPDVTDNVHARECARTIAGWKPLAVKPHSVRRLPQGRGVFPIARGRPSPAGRCAKSTKGLSRLRRRGRSWPCGLVGCSSSYKIFTIKHCSCLMRRILLAPPRTAAAAKTEAALLGGRGRGDPTFGDAEVSAAV
jgi:hypothetical protein